MAKLKAKTPESSIKSKWTVEDDNTNVINPTTTRLDAKIPEGPIKDKWTTYKDKIDLVNPANKRNIDVIVVGTGLAGGSACATLAELGYNVKAFAYQDSPRRAHSIAAQGGINAAKKLPRRWRFYVPSFLRYRKRRRLPCT